MRALELGVYLDAAAAYAGISGRTFRAWMVRGREDLEADPPVDSAEASLVEKIDGAMARWEVATLERLDQVGKGVWQKDAWRLERRLPDKYGRRNRVDVGDADGGPIRIVVQSVMGGEIAFVPGGGSVRSEHEAVGGGSAVVLGSGDEVSALGRGDSVGQDADGGSADLRDGDGGSGSASDREGDVS